MVVSEVFSQGFVTDRSAPLPFIYFFSGQIIYITFQFLLWLSIWIKPASFKEVMNRRFSLN